MSLYVILVAFAPILLYIFGSLFLISKKKTLFFALANIIFALAMMVGSIIFAMKMGTDYIQYMSIFSWNIAPEIVELGIDLKVDYISILFVIVNSFILLTSSIFDFIERSGKKHITFETGVVQNILLLIGFLNLLYMSGNLLTFLIALEGFTLGIIQIRRSRKAISDSEAIHYYLRFKIYDLLLYSALLVITVYFGYRGFNFSADLDLLVLTKKKIVIASCLAVAFIGILPRAGLLCFVRDSKSFLRQHSAISNLISIYSLAVVIYLLIVLSPIVEESQIFKNFLLIVSGVFGIYYLIKSYIQQNPKSLIDMVRYSDACFILMGIGAGAYAASTVHLIIHIFAFYLIGQDMRYLGVWGENGKFENLAKVRKQNPIGAYSLLFLIILLLGFPCIGSFATRLEIIWSILNGPTGWWGYTLAIIVSTVPIVTLCRMFVAFFGTNVEVERSELKLSDYSRYALLWLAAFMILIIGFYSLPNFVIGLSGRAVQSKIEISLLMNNIEVYESWYHVLSFWLLTSLQAILTITLFAITYKKIQVQNQLPKIYAKRFVEVLSDIEVRLVRSTNYVISGFEYISKKVIVPINKNGLELLGSLIAVPIRYLSNLISRLHARVLSAFIASIVTAIGIILVTFIIIGQFVS